MKRKMKQTKMTLNAQWLKLLELPSAYDRLTVALYKAMYTRGSFIAHFNREGFFKTRFATLSSFDETLKMMSEVPELNKLLKNTPIELIEMARYKIASLEANILTQQARINLEHVENLKKQFNKAIKLVYIIPELAEITKLTYESIDDNKLFDEIIFTHSLKMSEAEYISMEKDIDSFEIKGKGFICYAWNDCSGYEYWNIQQKQDNYIQITVLITDVIHVYTEDIIKAVKKARLHFFKYSQEVLEEKSK